MVKVVWLSKADACALLTAKNLYRRLRDRFPAERAAEDLFKVLALEKFQAAVQERCFAGGDETDHILVPVDRDVYLVLKAMGLCGEKDSKGRRICIGAGALHNWFRATVRSNKHELYIEALKILTTQLAFLFGTRNISNDEDIDSNARTIFGEEVRGGVTEAVWRVARYFDSVVLYKSEKGKYEGEAIYLLGKINELKSKLTTWILRRLREGTGYREQRIRRDGKCAPVYKPGMNSRETKFCETHLSEASKEIAASLAQSVVDVCVRLKFDTFWHGATEDATFVRNVLIKLKSLDPSLVVAYTPPPDYSEIKLGDMFDVNNAIRHRPGSLGLSADEVLHIKNNEEYIGKLIAIHHTSETETDAVSYLLQVLYQQYVVLFQDFASSVFVKRTYTLAQLGADPKTRVLVKKQFLDFFSEQELGPLRQLVTLYRASTASALGRTIDATPFHTSIENLVESVLENKPGSILDAYRNNQSRDVKEKTKKFLAQGLAGSALLSLLYLRRANIDRLQRNGVTENLPIAWRPAVLPAHGASLLYTLREYRDAGGSGISGATQIGLSADDPWVAGQSVQTKISEGFRECSGLGLRGMNRHTVFATEVIFEEFRNASDREYSERLTTGRHLREQLGFFSIGYIEALKHFYQDHERYDPSIFTDEFNSSFTPFNLRVALEHVVTQLHEFLNTYASTHSSRDSPVINLSLKLHGPGGDHYISLSPTKGTHGFFVTAPFLRWMICRGLVPKSTTAVVGWWSNGAVDLVEGSLQTCEVPTS